MEEAVSLYLYVDYLLDPRFPKNFSENSNYQTIEDQFKKYFDYAFDGKGFDFQKFEEKGLAKVNNRPPLKYDEMKRALVSSVTTRLYRENVFSLLHHPLFGQKCEVDSAKFVKILTSIRDNIKLDGSKNNLRSDIEHWGIDRFKFGLKQVFQNMGGFFNPALWTVFADEVGKAHGDDLELPQADSIVAVDHDDPSVIEIQRLGAQLIEQLQSANDLGSFSRDEASAAAGEVRQIMTAFEASRIRKRQVFEKAQATLQWIASKTSDALFGVIATGLLAAIAAYFGYQI